LPATIRRVPAYLLTEKRRYVAELKIEAVAAREAGLDAQWIEEVPVPFATRGAIRYGDAVQFDPAEADGSMNVLAFAYPGEHPEGIFRDTADQPHYFTWIDGLLVVMSEEDRETLQAYVRERFGDLQPRDEEWRRERDSNPR
ncbi:MAG TPA: hypothetical protein VHK90_02795, partial [Thermoanaerobaculia bacterium]|nr:hypothetical protein [Thermoanaerobaculia bacterium]